MSEASEELESAAAMDADAAAMALAFAGPLDPRAARYLEKQGRLADLQHDVLADKEAFELLHMRWRRFTDQMKGVLQVMTAIVGLAVATGFSLMVWQAAHSKGLLIEPFIVPPDMAEHGLTGEVVAAQLLDKLAVLGASESSRATQSYANNWGENIKVEIPETGVSIGELQRFLKSWLGHDTRISGEVYHAGTGIVVTARAGARGATFTGAEADLDSLMQKAAEHIFETTQPYRYGNYLDRNYNPVGLEDRVARATAIYEKLIAGDDPLERAWAWNGLGTIAANFHRDNRESATDYRKAIATVPDFTIGYFALGARDLALNRAESTIADYRTAIPLLHRDKVPDLDPSYLENARAFADAQLAMLTGDLRAGFSFAIAGAELPDSYSVLSRGNFKRIAAMSPAQRHDAKGLQAYLREGAYQPSTLVQVGLHAALEDWTAIPPLEASLRQAIAQSSGVAHLVAVDNYNSLRPQFAVALAHGGDFAGAQAMIGPTAADCIDCLLARAAVAELAGQRARADYWCSQAVTQAPSSPFGFVEWGRVLLVRGKPDDAIAQFTAANKVGPHFADPLEGRGEALMAKNQSHLALAKFAEAEKYAPNWGRLHLKWGEALFYAGKKDEAKAQMARAAQLDLTAAEKSELAQEKT